MNVFIDASAFIALWKKDDKNHKIAIQKSQKLIETETLLITSNIVIAETLTIMAMRISKQIANKFLEDLERSDIKIIFIDEGLHFTALKIFKQAKSKNLSFFDCTAFAVMKELKIDKAFSFDTDFKNYGFKLI